MPTRSLPEDVGVRLAEQVDTILRPGRVRALDLGGHLA